MSIDEENATKILTSMSDRRNQRNLQHHVRTALGSVERRYRWSALFLDFVESMASSGVVVGTFDSDRAPARKALGGA